MSALMFDHEGFTVVTQAWSVCPRYSGVRIAYVWGADRISWFDSATGTAAVTIEKLSMSEFVRLLPESGVFDLRKWQS